MVRNLISLFPYYKQSEKVFYQTFMIIKLIFYLVKQKIIKSPKFKFSDNKLKYLKTKR